MLFQPITPIILLYCIHFYYIYSSFKKESNKTPADTL